MMLESDAPEAWEDEVVLSLSQAMWGLLSPQLRAVAVVVEGSREEVTVFFAVTDADDEELEEDLDDIVGDLLAYLPELPDIDKRVHATPLGPGWEGFGHRLVLLTKDAGAEAPELGMLVPVGADVGVVAGRPPEAFPGEDGGRVSLAWENHIVVCLVQALLGHVTPQMTNVSLEAAAPDAVTVFFAVPAEPGEEVYAEIDQVIGRLRQLAPASLHVTHRVQVGASWQEWEGNRRERRLVIATKDEEDVDEAV